MRIGLMLSYSGPMGIWNAGCKAAARLAVAELNRAGGVHGKGLEIVAADAGTSAESAFKAARHLALDECVDAIIGLQPSNLRSAVERGLRGLAPYFYTAEWEGGPCAPGVVALGTTSREVLGPSIERLTQLKNAQRFYFLGTNYRWPQVGFRIACEAVSAAGGRMVGATFLPFGQENFERVFADIRRARPDVVIAMQLGDDAVLLHRAFTEHGLAPHCIRLCLAFDETQLLGIGAENSQNIWGAQRYFLSQSGDGRVSMIERYHTEYANSCPPPNHTSIGCYEAVHIAAGLAATTPLGDGMAMARLLGARFSGDEARLLSARPIAVAGLQLAEADGLDFRVRANI